MDKRRWLPHGWTWADAAWLAVQWAATLALAALLMVGLLDAAHCGRQVGC